MCTATLLAQVGAWLPAESVTMSPVDAVFVRMGAKDHIMMGQSTFLVELSETATMLSSATRCVLPQSPAPYILHTILSIGPTHVVVESSLSTHNDPGAALDGQGDGDDSLR